MNDPRRFRTCDTQSEALLGRALDAACEDLSSTPEERAEVWWGVCSRLAADDRRRAARGSSLAPLAVLGAAGALAAVVLGLYVAGRLPVTLATGTDSGVRRDGASQPAAEVASAERAARPMLPCELWTRLDRGDVGTFEFLSSAELDIRELEAFRVVRLQSGVLRVQVVKQDPARPLTLVTPQLQVVVLGTRFDISVEKGGSRIDLIEGHLRVQSTFAAVELGAGESITSDDPRLVPPATPLPEQGSVQAAGAPPAAPSRAARAPRTLHERPTRRDCDQERTPGGLLACLRKIADGADLAAQSALFELALLQRGQSRGDALALSSFGEYERRFPEGLLAPEVSLRRLSILGANGETKAALAEAIAFEARFPEDLRLPEVALTRAALTCGDESQSEAVLELLARLDSDPAMHAAVARVRERCSLRIGGPLRLDSPMTEPAGGGAPDD